MEWLSHQSRHDRKCDICNTPYRFRVIYDAEMPAQMPFGEVAKRVVTLAARVLLHFLCFFLFTVCIVQIPLFWKFITRLFTYAVDGKPMAHVPARHIILYGTYTTRARSGALLTGDASAFDRFQIIFLDTFLPGLLQVSMFLLVLFVILIEHEWVVREEGYTNLLLRQIGHEPRTKLADLLTQMRQHNWEPNAVPERDGDGNGEENGEENGERNGNDLIEEDDVIEGPETAEGLGSGIQSNRAGGALHSPETRAILINRAIEDLGHFQYQGAGESRLHQALERDEYAHLMHTALEMDGDLFALNAERRLLLVLRAHNQGPQALDDSRGVAHSIGSAHNPVAPNLDDSLNTEIRNTDTLRAPGNNSTDGENGSDVGENVSDSEIDLTQPPIGDDNMHMLRERLAAAQQRDHIIGLDQIPNHVLPNAIAAGRVRDDDDDTSISDTSHNEADEENAAADDNEPPEELERRRNLAEDEMMAAEAANEHILELLGFRFNFLTPLQLMMLADFFVILFLFAAYLLPHSIGNMVFFVGVSVVMGAYRMAAMRLVKVGAVRRALELIQNAWADACALVPIVRAAAKAADDLVLTPVRVLVRNGSSRLSAEPQSAWERAVYLGIGCFVICQAVRTYMRAMVAHEYPLTGSARRVYKMLFRVVVTAKVFAIFGIEIVVFPIYCGFLLDACLAPLFNARFVSQSPAGTQYHLLFTTSQELALNVYWRVLHNWVAGTCYMFVIALFVSMVRTRIFRPGVLFFIKSPEEPNARLIHDAVVKPFAMQISRIFLSAKVYLKLILGGIGAVTWALRLLVHSPFSAQEGAFLPIRLPTLTGYLALKLVVYSLVAERDRVAALCFRFWDASFAVLCHKLRLSHFVLDRPVPQERGYVVYRHALSRVFQLGALDYTLPVSYSEAQRMFRVNPDVHACFVPDGSYIRAPSSDDNSRTFLKRMFVSVSKHDQLLTPGDPAPALDPAEDSDTDWWDADIAFEDSYAVVYAPPHLRLRCFLLVCGVCLFAALLVVTVFVAAAAVGASIELATYKLVALIPLSWDARNFRYADALSILVGLRVLMYAVAAYERRPTLAEARRGVVAAAGPLVAVPAGLLEASAHVIVTSASLLAVNTVVCVAVHVFFLPRVETFFFGLQMLRVEPDGAVQFCPSWTGLLLHGAAASGTVIPALFAFRLVRLCVTRPNAFMRDLRLVALMVCAALVLVPVGVDTIALWPNGTASEVFEVALRMLIVVGVVFLRVYAHARVLLNTITEQIKQEKYVRGIAVANVPGEDDM